MNTNSNCPPVDRLQSFVDGQALTETETKSIDSHLSTCSVCAEHLERLSAIPEEYVAPVSNFLKLDPMSDHAPGSELKLSRRIIDSLADVKPKQTKIKNREPISTEWLEKLLGVNPDAKQLPQVDRYQLEHIISVSRMGAVFEAQDTVLDRRVCLKFASPLVEGWEQRFSDEARNAAQLNHPSIAHLLDCGEYRETPYSVYSLIGGSTLAEKIGDTPPTIEQATHWAQQIAAALEAAHRADIFHRDVKPANVLIDEDDNVKLIDFGLSIRETELVGERFVIAGTLPYAPPEQVDGQGKTIDGRADIYSLGVVLYEMLAGRVPFRTTDTEELCRAIINDPARPPRQIKPTIPAALETVCLKCLEKDPERRYGSAAELLGDLSAYVKATNRAQTNKGNPMSAASDLVIAKPTASSNTREKSPTNLHSKRDSKSSSSNRLLYLAPAILGSLIVVGFIGILASGWFTQANPPQNDPANPKLTTAIGGNQSQTNSINTKPDSDENPIETNLSNAESHLYMLQADANGRSRENALATIRDSGRDLVVLDAKFDNSPEGNWTQEELLEIRDGKSGRVVIAYLSVGEAESYRDYWENNWDPDADGTPSEKAPPFLQPENPDWHGNYRVKYWHDQWQNIVLESVDAIMAQGFDGFMLDRVDSFEDYERVESDEYEDDKINPGTGRTFREDMSILIERVDDRMKQSNENSALLIQNGTQMLRDNNVLDRLGGLVVENLLGQTEPDRREIIGDIDLLKADDRPVFAVEYSEAPNGTATFRQLESKLQSLGYRSLITDEDLTTVGHSTSK